MAACERLMEYPARKARRGTRMARAGDGGEIVPGPIAAALGRQRGGER